MSQPTYYEARNALGERERAIPAESPGTSGGER